MVPHLEKLLPPLLRELRCEDAINRQNAAFCAGVLAEGCGAEMGMPMYAQLLQVTSAQGSMDLSMGPNACLPLFFQKCLSLL